MISSFLKNELMRQLRSDINAASFDCLTRNRSGGQDSFNGQGAESASAPINEALPVALRWERT